MIIVFVLGRFDFNKCIVKCTNCDMVCEPWSDYCFVIKNGYWPGSLKSSSSYIFHQDVLRMWDILQKQMPGTSQKSYLEGLKEFSMQKGRVNDDFFMYFFPTCVIALFLFLMNKLYNTIHVVYSWNTLHSLLISIYYSVAKNLLPFPQWGSCLS